MRRRFKALRTPPRSAYDVIIVGAGVGGLTCANLLSRKGLQVLLIEQHYMVGGFCSTFRRAGFTFDAATHFYPVLGNQETHLGKLIRELGVENGWIRMDPIDTFHFPDGSHFEVPADFDTYLSELKFQFPEEASALDRFFAEVREANVLGMLYYFRGHRARQLERYHDLTVRQVLERHFHNTKLKLLLTADSPHWGSPPNRTSFMFDSILRVSYFLGNYYPAMGSQAFIDELALRFEEHGGHILMSSQVEKILIRDGRACGVTVETTRGRLRGRRHINAETIVCNTDLTQMIDHLVGPEHFDPSYREAVRRLRPTHPCFITHIGLKDVKPEHLARAQGYYWRSWDADQAGSGSVDCKIFAPTLYEPRLAPPGGQILIVEKVLQMDFEAIEDWPAHKARVEAFLLECVERVLPGITEKIVVCLSATAKTSHRFTLNHHGAMLGWEQTPDQLGTERPAIESPIEDLFLVGHWTRPGGGIAPVMISAQQAAEAVLGRDRFKAGGGE